MPKTKRKRLYTTPKKKQTPSKSETPSKAEPLSLLVEREVRAVARGRLMGALLDVLEADELESDAARTPGKRGPKPKGKAVEEEAAKASYVLKLFDRSVDLSQFTEDTPLYPICRAWITNQPRANYNEFGQDKYPPIEETEESVDLPGPEGPTVSRIPELLPEQKAASKDNINLDYNEVPPLSLQTLINSHVDRWATVRRAWQNQAAKVEARYSGTQRVLNEITRLNG